MPLARKLYRKCKVWADVDESGQLVEQRGLVKIRYRQDSEETYSAKVSEIADVDPSDLKSAPTPADEAAGDAKPRAKSPRRAAPRKVRAGGKPKSIPADALLIHTDGSCFGNPGPAGIGIVLDWKGTTKEISRFLGEGTNNIAELTAIQVALEQVKNRRLPVRVFTDSAYAIGVLSEGWKVKVNRELVAAIQALLREFTDLQFVKVRGHSGDPRNEQVDQLARDAIIRRA